VGKTWLRRALDALASEDAHFNVTITRKPFFLYPGGDHPLRLWGERVNRLYHPRAADSLVELGASAGYTFDMRAPLSDTMNSHRLVLWAQSLKAGKGEELAQALGHRYFEQGRPLGDLDMLCESVAAAGLDPEAARAYLESDAGYDDVRSSVDALHRAGTTSIPVFIFRSGESFRQVVHGSADVPRFTAVLRAAQAHWDKAASPPSCDR